MFNPHRFTPPGGGGGLASNNISNQEKIYEKVTILQSCHRCNLQETERLLKQNKIPSRPMILCFVLPI